MTTRSPFKRKGIRLIKFWVEIPGDGLELDPETGNPRPSQATQECLAYPRFSKSKGDFKETSLPGTDVQEAFVTGYLVEPLDLPSVGLPVECSAEYAGIVGTLKITATLPAVFEKVEQKLGQSFQGYWRSQG